MRPPTIAGLPYAWAPPGNPNAHLSLRFGTSAAVRPGFFWKRLFVGSAPKPFHCGFDANAASRVSFVGHALASAATAPSDLPESSSATARFSATVRLIACVLMLPVVIASRIASGLRSFSAARDGVRPCGLSWQVEQLSPYAFSALTAGCCASAELPRPHTTSVTNDQRQTTNDRVIDAFL